MSRTNGLLTVALLAVALAGCDKSSESSPSASAPASTATAKPTASASAPGGLCPPGSTGKGTGDAPCVGSGRVLEAKWTGKTGKKSVFSVTNKLKTKIDFVQCNVYYYDASGKQLTVTTKGREKWPDKSWSGSGGLFSIGPGETKEVELGWPPEMIPKNAKTIEAEFNKVGWPIAGTDDDNYWENDSLVGADRPMGGKK